MTTTESTRLQRGASNLRVTLGILGILSIVVGLLILLFPGESGRVVMSVIAAMTAAYAFIAGIAYLGNSIFSKTLGGWARVGHILLGLLYIVAGIVITSNLAESAAVLALFTSISIGVLWLFEGIMAFSTLSESPSKGWSVFYGIASVLAGGVLIFSPIIGIVTLWWLLGISLVVLGLMQVIRAFTINPKKFAGIE